VDARYRRYTALRELTVRRNVAVTPRMRRITLGGDQLGDFATNVADDHVRLVFAELPTRTGEFLDWPQGCVYRTYTVRRFDRAAAELEVDVFLHGNGVAADWARRAAPGDVIHVAGPKLALPFPAADAYVVVGDETALPAIARLLDELDTNIPVHALIEIGNHDDRQALSREESITWIERDPARPPGERLDLALRALAWPAGTVFAWGAGETNSMRRISRHLREHRNAPSELRKIKGYWSTTPGTPQG
jgi:NADPH-dependent ferric siderophore reductase